MDEIVDIGGADPPLGAFVEIDPKFEVRLPPDIEDADLMNAGDFLQAVLDLRRQLFEFLQVRAKDLDRVISLDAGERLGDVVPNVL